VVGAQDGGLAGHARLELGVLKQGEGADGGGGAVEEGRSGEHVFGKLWVASDGTGGRCNGACRVRARYTLLPREPQTSIFVRTRSMTSVVNSVLPACPPRSGVLMPAATASRTDS
jgi:hypothetical protein